jgi:hypothetical protein
MGSASELWYVQLSDGDVHRVTLDQLDEGFQAGHIDANTMVLADGARRWAKLGEIAGIDDVAPARPPPVYVQRSLPAPPVLQSFPAPLIESHRPVSVDLSDLEVVPGLPSRSRKRWVGAVLGVVTIGGVAGVAVERPSAIREYMSNAYEHITAAKSWIAAAVPQRLFATQPAAPSVSPSPPEAASLPAADTTTLPAPATTTPPPTAQNTEPSALPPTPTPAHSASAAKPQARGVAPKAPARKVRAKAAVSADSVSKLPSAFATSGNKFDPLSSTIH